MRSVPKPIQTSTAVVPRCGPKSPQRSEANPSPPSAIDHGVRNRAKRPSGSVAPSRTAAIGGQAGCGGEHAVGNPHLAVEGVVAAEDQASGVRLRDAATGDRGGNDQIIRRRAVGDVDFPLDAAEVEFAADGGSLVPGRADPAAEH